MAMSYLKYAILPIVTTLTVSVAAIVGQLRTQREWFMCRLDSLRAGAAAGSEYDDSVLCRIE
jgi:hypothetical protein